MKKSLKTKSPKAEPKSKKSTPRPIIEEFAKEIKKYRMPIANDRVIKFRDDKVNNKIREAFKVPIELLRFRKDNGRIASDVLTYEKDKGKLNESTDFGQSELKRFLAKKDPEPTQDLRNSITKDGQEEFAVITADGFLINGNRRKMVLESLLSQHKGDERFKYLKVVILPGLKESEPPPTNEEIEQIENRYQFQKTGKAEYYNFDMALAIKRKLDLGMDLEEILLDDPNYQGLKGKALQKKIREFEEEYIEPLKCVDKYLEFLGRPGHYNTVSEGKGDNEGRWQAFLDYYKLFKKINNEKDRIRLGIQDGDEGKIENIAFKIIRKRILPGVDKKVHQIMRDLPKLLTNTLAKKELFKIVKIDFSLTKDEITDEEGKEVDEKTKDTIWGSKFAQDIGFSVKRAFDILEQKKEQDSLIDLLNDALDKLNHPNMDVNSIEPNRINEAITLTKEIQTRGGELESSLYDLMKTKSKKTAK